MLNREIEMIDQTFDRFGLGRKLGHKKDELASFRTFLGPAEANQDSFKQYLRSVIVEKPASDCLDKLDRPNECLAALQVLPELLRQSDKKQFHNLPPDYFIGPWQQLDLLAQKKSERAKTKLDEMEAALRTLPRELSTTTQVRLYLIDANGRRALEFIRFSEAPPKGSTP